MLMFGFEATIMNIQPNYTFYQEWKGDMEV